MSSPSAAAPLDFCIITALEEERDAVLSMLPGHRKLDRDGSGAHTYFEAQVQTRRGDGAAYRVIVTCLAGMGPIRGANKASAVISRWAPRHVLVVGIAGGIAGEVALGDVLVASDIVDYTLGKERNQEPREVRWRGYPADSDLLDAVNNFATGWEELVSHPRPGAGAPQRRIGVVASGGDVIASERVISRYLDDHPKLIGVEMEGSGVAAALHEDMSRPRFLMIRSVSDLANGPDNARTKESWRSYACHAAAAYAVGLLRDGPVPAGTLHLAGSTPTGQAHQPGHLLREQESLGSAAPSPSALPAPARSQRPSKPVRARASNDPRLTSPVPGCVGGLVVLGMISCWMICVPKNASMERNEGGKSALASPADAGTELVSTAPSTPAVPVASAHVSTEGIPGLRRLHGVRALEEGETGQRLDRAPAGTFGYVRVSSTASSMSTSFFFRAGDPAMIEIHKLSGGSIMITGYTRESDARALKRGRPPRIVLSPTATRTARIGVAVPAEWVQSIYARESPQEWLELRETIGELILELGPPEASPQK